MIVASPTGNQCAEHHGDAHGVFLLVDKPATTSDEGGPVEQLDEEDRSEESDSASVTSQEPFMPLLVCQVRLDLGGVVTAKLLPCNSILFLNPIGDIFQNDRLYV